MRRKKLGMSCLLILSMLLSGCAVSETGGTLVSADETYETTGEDGADYELEDNKALYDNDDDGVITMYLTVGRGNEGEDTDHTWTEVNSHSLEYYDEKGIAPYKCEAVLQIGDEEGPLEDEFGYSDRTANATVQLRGQGASTWPQKSYRIKIKDGSGEWRDQQTITLNKHVSDPLRFKNKLAYSLMEDIPEMMAARTQFVHLYVKDKTEGEDGLFEDYGLYTQVEQVNKKYLRTRGFDGDGALYQVTELFDWLPHEDSILEATDPSYDKERFEQYLEIDGSEEHDAIVKLLKAVNDEELPVSDIVEQYFDADNLFYWMAFHILLGNSDVLDGNYYLYNARGQDRWYFISWNNSGILGQGYEELQDPSYSRSWQKGIFLFSDTPLFERILQDDTCRTALNEAVEDLRKNYLSEDIVEKKISDYSKVVKEYLYQLPDQTYARVTQEDYTALEEGLIAEIEENYAMYQESMSSVWPFHILTPENTGGQTVLNWEEAYRFSGGEVAYTVELSRDFSFNEHIVQETVDSTSLSVDALPAGQYFLRVRAEGEDGFQQDAYEYYGTEAGTKCYSTLCFYVQGDGSITAVEYSED